MTEGNAPKTNINKTYELDVDDVGSVPHCESPEIQKHTDERYLYSAPYQTEPVYESPLCLEMNDSTTQKRETAGRRSKRNDIYETTNDDALPNGQCYTGYTYARNTEHVIPRFAYDNPVRVTAGDADHKYEESFRNSRFSENVVYHDTDSSNTLTIQGIRDTRTGASNRYPYGKDTRKPRANCVQIFTLLLSILACLIAVFALLVASGNVKLNDVQNETVNPSAMSANKDKQSGNRGDGVESWKQNYTELVEKYNELVESSKQNYTKLMAKYNEQVESSKQNYTKIMDKYNQQVESSQQIYTELMAKYNTMTNQFSSKLVGVVTVSKQLNKTLKSINSKFTAQLRNISKQMGPRGFNGTQGPPGLSGPQGPKGEQGVGNLSACIVGEKVEPGAITNPGRVTVSHEQRPKSEIPAEFEKEGHSWLKCNNDPRKTVGADGRNESVEENED